MIEEIEEIERFVVCTFCNIPHDLEEGILRDARWLARCHGIHETQICAKRTSVMGGTSRRAQCALEPVVERFVPSFRVQKIENGHLLKIGSVLGGRGGE